MAYPEWFQPEHYATLKVDQMNDIKYLGRSDWDAAGYTAELENFRDELGKPLAGETVEDKAYTNFLACNGANYLPEVPRGALNISPNENFDVGVYLQNLADHENRINEDNAPEGGWTMESMLQHLYSDLHMSAWEHYTTVGQYANINPSNSFNTLAYMQARVNAMNEFENPDGTKGWQHKDTWTLEETRQLFAEQDINPIMDLYGTGGKTFGIEATGPAKPTEVPEDWTPWTTPQPHNPYDDVEETVSMTAPETAYIGKDGVNTRFEAVWDNATDASTIYTTDAIHGGANAYNTLAFQLDAPWPGFRGQNGPNVTNVGQVELTHGSAQPGTPYNFDARNIDNLQRVEVHDNGAGAISLKNLGAAIKQVNLHELAPGQTTGENADAAAPGAATQTTSIEYAAGAIGGTNDALSLGVDNVGADNAPAPVRMNGIENLTVNALAGSSVVNLQNVTGVRNLKVDGGGDVKITNVANGIQSYDASASTGIVNMAASDLKAATPVLGGSGLDTLTLTQDFSGAPANWSNIDYLAVNPGVKAAIQGQNIHGLTGLWVNTAKDVSLTDLGQTGTFRIFEQFDAGSKTVGKVTVQGEIRNLVVSTADYAAEEGAIAKSEIIANAANDITVNALGQSTLASKMTFVQAAGAVTLAVNEEAAFAGSITAVNATELTASIAGALNNGAKFNVVDKAAGSVTINAANGIAATSPDAAVNNSTITLDSDGATKLNITSGGHFALAGASSLKGAQDISISLDGADAEFIANTVALPNAHNLNINGGNVELGTLGGSTLNHAIEIAANCEVFSTGKITTGSNGNIIANITAADNVRLGTVSAGGSGTAKGDVHLTVDAETLANNVNISGADVFVNFSSLKSGSNATISAAESINYTGSENADSLTVTKVGMRGPSNIDFGAGSDSLYINSNVLNAGQLVHMDIDLGEGDGVEDVLSIRSQSAGRLGLYVDNFAEGIDEIDGFSAASISASQAHTLLSQFGVANVPAGALSLTSFGGSGRGVLYDGDLYGFNSATNATTMVVLQGVGGGVSNLEGIIPVIPEDPDTGTDTIA